MGAIKTDVGNSSLDSLSGSFSTLDSVDWSLPQNDFQYEGMQDVVGKFKYYNKVMADAKSGNQLSHDSRNMNSIVYHLEPNNAISFYYFWGLY